MSDRASLERGYRRVLACYPRAFRRENEDEILTVLMASAVEGQRRVGLAESADLIRGALRMHLRFPSRPPRRVVAAVRLMCAAAAVQLTALITIVVTAGAVRSAIVARNPSFSAAQWHAVVTGHIVPDVVSAPIGIAVWLWLAWANGRGHNWARFASGAFFGLFTLGLLFAVAQDAAIYATADLIAAIAEWLVAFAGVVLVFSEKSLPYYRQELAHR